MRGFAIAPSGVGGARPYAGAPPGWCRVPGADRATPEGWRRSALAQGAEEVAKAIEVEAKRGEGALQLVDVRLHLFAT